MKRICAIFFTSAALLCGSILPCPAAIRLARVISDHAVLQRAAPIRIWGWATPGAALAVKLHGQTVPALADRLGEWTAWLMPEAAGGPYTLTIQGQGDEGSAQVSDILIGDVWLASGQSNMEMPLSGFPPTATVKNAEAEITAATNPQLRLLLVEHRSSNFPLDDLTTSWTECNPETAAKFSAVAYFFGREIALKEHVPIGLIDATWGGTPADSWVSMQRLGSDPALLPAFASRARFTANIARQTAMIAAEKREDEEAKASGKLAPNHNWHPSETSWLPSGLYNGMISPVAKYSLKGFLWYQGETNSSPDRASHYASLFQALIEDWRSNFAQGDLPFLYAQISSFNSPREDWGIIRDSQRRALALRNTAMAVTLDVGDAGNVHPADKQTVAARLALGARGIAYGEAVEYSPPLFREATSVTGGMQVWFDNAQGLTTRGNKLEGFELAGEDHHFMAAEATLEGKTVLVRQPGVLAPHYVRYAWSNVAPPSLYNAAGLPASTFTSEEFPER